MMIHSGYLLSAHRVDETQESCSTAVQTNTFAPTDFASAALLGPTKGGTLYDAQGHMIEAHGTRTVYMRIGPEGQSVGAES